MQRTRKILFMLSCLSLFFFLLCVDLALSIWEWVLLAVLDCPRQLFILWQRSKLKINICLRCASNSQNWNDKDLFGTDENSMPCRMICWRKRTQRAHTHVHVHVYLWCHNKCTCTRSRTYQPNKIKPKWKHAWFHSHETHTKQTQRANGAKKKLSSNFQFQPHTAV